MFDKLSTINTCLIRTGNNRVAFEGDGSDEWVAGDDAYESELPLLLADHDWGFAKVTRPLARSGTSGDPRYADAYAKPVDCLQIIMVWLDSVPIPYSIVDNKICCTTTGSASAPVALFIKLPPEDQWPPHFLEALRLRIMSCIYRGLNEDAKAADGAAAEARAMLEQAKTRSDQEAPPRAFFVPRMRMARMIRRGGGSSTQSSS